MNEPRTINRDAVPLQREMSRHPILTLFNRDGDDLAWHGQAACNGLGDVMFPTQRDGRAVDYRDALSLCHGTPTRPGCPVIAECLEWALAADEQWGVWGGATPAQRQAIANRRQGGAA